MARPVLALRAYEVGDIDAVEATPDFVAERAGEPEPTGFAWTITRDGQPIACGGAAHPSPGVFGVWSYLSGLSLREWVFAARATEEKLAFLIDTLGAERLVAYAGRPASVAFLERLGFREIELFILPGGDPAHLMERTA